MMQGKSIAEGFIQQGNKAMNEQRIHPTQKPVALYTWLFQKYAKPGDSILDTHLGSGSSRIAALELGLDFVGYESTTTKRRKGALRNTSHKGVCFCGRCTHE